MLFRLQQQKDHDIAEELERDPDSFSYSYYDRNFEDLNVDMRHDPFAEEEELFTQEEWEHLEQGISIQQQPSSSNNPPLKTHPRTQSQKVSKTQQKAIDDELVAAFSLENESRPSSPNPPGTE